MFKIGEFSRLTQVSIRMLRYYDETGLLKPTEVDAFTNYRLYSVEQIATINKIKFLRDLGFSVSEIAVILTNWNDDYIASQLEKKRIEIQSVINSEEDRLLRIDSAMRDIHMDKITINYNVSIKSSPAYQVLSLRRVVIDYSAEGSLWKEMAEFIGKMHIEVAGQAFTFFHDVGSLEDDVDMEVCAPVTRTGQDQDGFTYRQIEPVPILASFMVFGPFFNIAEAFLGFAAWLQEHNQHQMGEYSRQVVHRGPWNEEDPDKYLTEIQIPLIDRD